MISALSLLLVGGLFLFKNHKYVSNNLGIYTKLCQTLHNLVEKAVLYYIKYLRRNIYEV